jgi:AraC-like DNA-binding protein
MNEVCDVDAVNPNAVCEKPAPALIGAAGVGADQMLNIAHLCVRLLQSGHGQARLSYWQERTAKELMMAHLGSAIQISVIAKECALSRSHFSRAFKNSTGHTPSAWLLRARLARAKELLAQTDWAIAQVGYECGFADQPHFTRVFARELGMAPGKWRVENKRLEARLSVTTEPPSQATDIQSIVQKAHGSTANRY